MPVSSPFAIVHPDYDAWVDEWKLLRDAYEGSGGFLNGEHLVAHPREVDYKRDTEGRVTTTKLQDKPKFTRRKAIARYEHFAATIVDTLAAFQFNQGIVRTIGGASAQNVDHPLARFWEDVDGFGTHIDDFLHEAQELAHVYGHVFVLIDRQPFTGPVRTRAEQPPPRLVLYTPLDVPDWLVDRGHIIAVKTVDYVERSGLDEQAPTEDVPEFRLWDALGWQTIDEHGNPTEDAGQHQMGEVPIVVIPARRRAGNHVIGRSSLGAGSLYKDHFNLISELRELLRAQTFSMLQIGLAENEQISDARARLGDSSGVETVVFTKNGASFIAPPTGPADVYQAELEKLERKMFRAAGLPWETDSRDAESSEARGRKSQDLNKRVAMHADFLQRADWAIARLFYIATFGRDAGLQRYANDDIAIVHPNEFVERDMIRTVEEIQAKLSVPMGQKARALILTRSIGDVLPDLDDDEKTEIADEIEATPEPEPPPVADEGDDEDDEEAVA